MINIKNFAILENKELWLRPVILHLESGVIGYPIFLKHEDQEGIEKTMEDLAQQRKIGVRVSGYSIFILYSKTIVGLRPSTDSLFSILRSIAEFFVLYKIDPKPNRYVVYSDNYYRGCPGDWKPLTPEQLAAKKARKAEKNKDRLD